MADFSDVASGFDLEAIIDEQALRHLVQVFTEAEQSIAFGTISLLKNFPDIIRDYDRTGFTSGNFENDKPLMRIIEPNNSPDHFYVALAPANFGLILTQIDNDLITEEAFIDLFVILRINRTIELSNLITDFQNSEGDAVFNVFQDAVRIEGLQTGLGLDNTENDDLEDFLTALRASTETFYNELPALADQYGFEMPEIPSSITQIMFDSADGYELFLTALHNLTGISGLLKGLVASVDTRSPFILNEIHAHPITGKKLAFYANFNTPGSGSRGTINNAVNFTDDEVSGVGINLTESLAQDLLLAFLQFEMAKKVDEEEITQARFDSLNFSYPFNIPTELIDVDGFPIDASFFEINRLELKRVKHKFPDRSEKVEAIKLEVIISNFDTNAGEAFLDAFVPNPRVKLFLAFENNGDDLTILIDSDVNIPFNLLAGLFVLPLGLYAILTGVANIVADKAISEAIDREITPNLSFAVLKKRWDPFYETGHLLRVLVKNVLLHDDSSQLKLLADVGLSKSFEPYQSLYLEEVEFDDENNITEFNYKLNSISSVIADNMPAHDRIEDMYDKDELTRTIGAELTPEILSSLRERAELSKIRVDLPYSPQFVRFDGGSIESIRILSNLRRSQLKNDLIEEYTNDEVQKILDLFLELLVVLVPDYDVDSITDEQLSDVTSALRDLILESSSYAEYSETGWLRSLTSYLRRNPSEMITASPLQIVLLGLSSSSVSEFFNIGTIPNETFDFLDLPDYQAIAFDDRIFIRNSPNSTRTDNLSNLPEF